MQGVGDAGLFLGMFTEARLEVHTKFAKSVPVEALRESNDARENQGGTTEGSDEKRG